MSLSIATVNLLSPHTDLLREHVPSQEDRIPLITPVINAFAPDVLVVCEAEDEQRLSQLAELTGREVKIMRAQEDAAEIIALLAKPELEPDTAESFVLGSDTRRFGVSMTLGSLMVVGVHYPWSPTQSRERAQISNSLLVRSAEFRQAVIAGDFNSHPHQQARRLYEDAGFSAASSMLSRRESGYPSAYRRAQLPFPFGYMIPQFQADDIVARGLEHSGVAATVVESDHPVIHSNLV